MKIRLHLHQGQAHLHLKNCHNKKKQKSKLKTSRSTSGIDIPQQQLINRSNILTSNIEKNIKISRSTSRRQCSHKKKNDPLTSIENEYYRSRYDDADQLRKQNEKLIKQNKVLNEYFRYFEKKYNAKEKHRSDKIFSFRSADPIAANLLFGQQCQNSSGGETKSSSKFRVYGV